MMKKRLFTILIGALLVVSAPAGLIASPTNTVNLSKDSAIYMPDVTQEMSDPTYWTDKQNNVNGTLMSEDEIKAANESYLTTDGTNMHDLKNMTAQIDGKAVSDALYSYTKELTDGFIGSQYDANGDLIEEGYFDDVVANAKNPDAASNNTIKYAICVYRTNILIYPSTKAVLDDPDDNDFDNIYETAVRVNEPLVIRSVSADGQFYAVYSSNSSGWISAEDVAICSDKQEWLDAWDLDFDDTMIVYGSKIYTEDSKTTPQTANRKMSMGTTLEIADPSDYTSSIGNRAGYNNYVVWMPVRNDDGSYSKELALISEHEKVHEGYLSVTKANIASVAFEMLGDTYGWGGMLSSDDCSGYVRDIYKCFGFEMPRNTTWQKAIDCLKYDISEYTDEQKRELIEALPIGSVLFFSGHEMMYLGSENGKSYVISSTSSIMNPDGSAKQRARAIMINTLDIKRANGNTWLGSLNTITIPYYDATHVLSDEVVSDNDTNKDITKLTITAKKGSKQIKIATIKECKLVISSNKKVFKNNSKKVKKITINSSKKNNTIKLASKLKKGTKITVKATKSGYIAKTKSITVK